MDDELIGILIEVGIISVIVSGLVSYIVSRNLQKRDWRREDVKEIDVLLTSLFVEAGDNLDTLKANLERKELGERKEYIPFKIDAYRRYCSNMSLKIIQTLGIEAEKHLSKAYNFIDDFNRLHDLDSERLKKQEDRYFHQIKDNLETFIDLFKMRNP
ncbi:unnamed protein product [marine sediment metagenome]|uniref:Uncharacterized protein n=1 Tax=marine sediment metagenome TaxID=412755 RepID=X0RW38_9ZZZZ